MPQDGHNMALKLAPNDKWPQNSLIWVQNQTWPMNWLEWFEVLVGAFPTHLKSFRKYKTFDTKSSTCHHEDMHAKNAQKWLQIAK